MAEKSMLDRALALALEAHAGMIRKKDRIPYILHPMEVAVIAATLTWAEDVLAAAVLHDTVEDAGITLEEISAVCSPSVAALVASETENKRVDLPPQETWKIRKTESLKVLKNAGDPRIKILWLSDKLANIRSFYRLWLREGDAMWQDFNETRPSEQAWYYRTIETLLADLKDTLAWQEYHALVEKIFGGIPR